MAIGNTKQLHLFQGKSFVIYLFMLQQTVRKIFFTDCCVRNFSLPESKLISTPRNVFWIQARCGNPIFSPFVNISLMKTCFSVHITHSVTLTWFALLSHQKFSYRPLFQLEALCLICHRFEFPQSKYFRLFKIIYAIKKFQTM